MPSKNRKSLPENLQKKLPQHAQKIYNEALTHSLEEYKNPEKKRYKKEDTETIAHKVAWSAVKQKI